MENTPQAQKTAPQTDRFTDVVAEECPTCISGTDHTIGAQLFQKALRSK